jgi:hypothetical protein
LSLLDVSIFIVLLSLYISLYIPARASSLRPTIGICTGDPGLVITELGFLCFGQLVDLDIRAFPLLASLNTLYDAVQVPLHCRLLSWISFSFRHRGNCLSLSRGGEEGGGWRRGNQAAERSVKDTKARP